MISLIKTPIIIIVAMLQICNAEIYRSSISMKWSLYTPAPTTFTVLQIFNFENDVSEFFNNEIRTSPTFANQDVYMVTFDLKGQDVDMVNVLTVLDAEMTLLYTGTQQDSFATLLKKVVSDKKTQLLLENFIDNGYFKKTSTSSRMNFEVNGPSIKVASTSENETLFICLIALVGVLILTSFSILVSSIRCGCFRRRHSSADDLMGGIKPSTTMETANDSPHNSPAKLGARRNLVPDDADSAYAITPVRKGVLHPEMETPDSQCSHQTDVSNTSRNPLGIMRLNTLNKIALEPKTKFSTKSMYQITLHESDDEESALGK